MCGQSKKGQRSHPAEGYFARRLVTPVIPGFFEVDMVFIHQGKPDIHIEKIRRALLLSAEEAARAAWISSESRIA
jgi:hypothetical protein